MTFAFSFHLIGEGFTSDVSTDNGLDGEDTEGLDDHGAAFELSTVRLDLGRELVKVGGDEVVGQDILQEREPKNADLGQQLSLVGDAL